MELICPISPESINKRASRIGAALTALLLVLYAFTGFWLVLVLVVLDYVVRVMTPYQAPMAALATWVAKAFGIKPKLMNKGPKIFAWRVGFLMAIVSLALVPISPEASIIVALGLAAFNVLDGVFNLCVGCVIYTYVVLPYFGPTKAKNSAPAAVTNPVDEVA
jgi:hypothetical protein